VWNEVPEFEDCRKAAQQHGVAVKEVMQSASAAAVELRHHESLDRVQ
jgi:uncharacterized protein (DUF111 family)